MPSYCHHKIQLRFLSTQHDCHIIHDMYAEHLQEQKLISKPSKAKLQHPLCLMHYMCVNTLANFTDQFLKSYLLSHPCMSRVNEHIMNTTTIKKYDPFLSAEQEPPPGPSLVGGGNPQLTLSSSTCFPPCKSQIYIKKKVSTTSRFSLTENKRKIIMVTHQ